jgi:putative endonuclease
MVNALSLRKKSMDKKNYTYILQCNDGSFYTGWTNNLDRRLKAHNKGNASKYTRSRLPVRLVYYEEYSTKQEAMSREYAIKRLCRKEKIRLIEKYQSEKRKHNDTVTGTSGHNE